MTATFGFSWDGYESRKRDDEPPVGDGYLMEITQATEIKVAKNNRRGFSFGCKIVEGQHAGKMIWQWLSLEPENIEWTKGTIETLGREDILKPDGMPADLVGTVFQADIIERGGFKNIVNIVPQGKAEEKPAPQRPARAGARR